MRGWGAASLGLLACSLLACGGQTKQTPAGEPPVVEEPEVEVPPESVGPALVFDVQPDDAEVFVDGEAAGVASEVEASGPMSVASGLHQIIITKDGYQTWRAEVSVKDGPEKIEVRLEQTE